MSKYTIEKHGDGYAIYFGRDFQHHGFNIGHLTEVTPATIKLIQDALNASLAQPEQEPDYGIDRGAWSDVPDATKWVDELRGDEVSQVKERNT